MTRLNDRNSVSFPQMYRNNLQNIFFYRFKWCSSTACSNRVFDNWDRLHWNKKFLLLLLSKLSKFVFFNHEICVITCQILFYRLFPDWRQVAHPAELVGVPMLCCQICKESVSSPFIFTACESCGFRGKYHFRILPGIIHIYLQCVEVIKEVKLLILPMLLRIFNFVLNQALIMCLLAA